MLESTEKGMGIGIKITVISALVIVFLFVAAIFTRVTFFNFIDNYEFGYLFDKRTGQITEIERTGYVFSYPFVQSVHTIEIRPIQICINASTNTQQRVLNCKLVVFSPSGFRKFIEWHGRGNYDHGALSELLKIYAFDQTDDPEKLYPFLKIQKTLSNTKNIEPNGEAKKDSLQF